MNGRADRNATALRVVLLGLGTVGRAVAIRLVDEEWRAHVSTRGISPPELVAVGVRDPQRPRSLGLPASVLISDDLRAVVARDDVDVVVELLGGLEPARTLTEAAIGRGVAVVTANKMLLAELGPALER